MDTLEQYILKNRPAECGIHVDVRDREDGSDIRDCVIQKTSRLLWLLVIEGLESKCSTGEDWNGYASDLGISHISNDQLQCELLLTFLHEKVTGNNTLYSFDYMWNTYEYGREDMLFKYSIWRIKYVTEQSSHRIDLTHLEHTLKGLLDFLWQLLVLAAEKKCVDILNFLPEENVIEGFNTHFEQWLHIKNHYSVEELCRVLQQHALLNVPMTIEAENIFKHEESTLIL